MAPKAPIFSAILLLLPFLLFSPSAAHNITRLLEHHPDFATFNSLLSQTKLADEINRRSTITVLAVDGSGLGGVSGLPTDVLKRVLSVHVVLDYYDEQKLHHLSKKSTILTTLFQTTGVADQRKGFLNVTILPDGNVAFGSAVAGAGLTANLVKVVAEKPYNLSVLHVSGIIVPPGIDNLNFTAPPPPKPVAAPAPAPSKSKKSKAPVAAPVEAPEASSPAPAADAPVADAPVSDAPAPVADAPASDAPLASPPSPIAADESADAPAPTKSSAGRVAVGAGVGVVMGAVLLGAL